VINSYQLWTGVKVEDSLTDLYVDCSLIILMWRKIGCVSRGSGEGPRGGEGEKEWNITIQNIRLHTC